MSGEGISLTWIAAIGGPMLGLFIGSFLFLVKRIDQCKNVSHADMEILKNDVRLRLDEGREDRGKLRDKIERNEETNSVYRQRAEDHRANILLCLGKVPTKDDLRDMENRLLQRFGSPPKLGDR